MPAQQGQYTIIVRVDDAQFVRKTNDIKRALDDMAVKDKRRSDAMTRYATGNAIKSVRDEKKAYKDLTRALQDEHQRRMKLNRNSLNAQTAEHKRHLEIMQRAEKEHSARVTALRSKSAGGRAKNRFAMAKESAGGGMIGTMKGVSAATGGIGLAVAAAGAAVTAFFSKSSQVAQQFEKDTARIKTLLTDTAAEALPGAIEKLTRVAQETGTPMGELQTSLYNVISAVPDLANNLDAATSISEKAAKTAIGLGASTEGVTLAMTNLGNATGANLENVAEQDHLFDVLANTMKQGVIPSAEELAANISKAAPLVANLSENSREAIDAQGAMTAALTQNGVKVEESQTMIKALTQTLMDSTQAQKLMNAGLKGFDPQTRKVTDWSALVQSMGTNMNGFLDSVSSVEAKQAIALLAKEGGTAFAGLVDSMQNAKGTAQGMFETMAETSAQAGARLSSSWEVFLGQAGKGASGFMATVKGALADGLVFLTNLFKSAEEKYTEAAARAEELRTQAIEVEATVGMLGGAIDQALATGSAEDIGAGFDAVKGKMDVLVEASPFVAQQIQAILNDPSKQTVEGLTEVEGKLAEIAEISKGQAALAALEEQEAAYKALGKEVSGYGLDQIAMEERSLANAEERLAKLNQEFAAAEGNAMLRANLDKERLEAQNDVIKAQGELDRLQAETEKGVQRVVEAEIARASALGENLTKEEARQNIINSMPAKIRDVAGSAAAFTAQLDEQLDTFYEQQEVQEEQDAIERAKIEHADELTALEGEVAAILEEQGVNQAATNEEKIKGLEAARAEVQAMIGQMEAEIALKEVTLTLEEAILQLMNAKTTAAANLAEAEGRTVVDKQVQIANLKEEIALAKAKVGVLKAQDQAIGGQIEKLRAMPGGAAVAGAGGGGRGGKSAADKEAEKARKEEIKAAKEAAKFAEEEAKARKKALEDEIKSRVQEIEQRFKSMEAEKERGRALHDLVRDLGRATADFKDKLDKQIADFASGQFGELASTLSRFSTSIQQAQIAASNVIANFFEQQGVQAGEVASLEREREDKRRELRRLQQDIADMQAQMRDLRSQERSVSGQNQSRAIARAAQEADLQAFRAPENVARRREAGELAGASDTSSAAWRRQARAFFGENQDEILRTSADVDAMVKRLRAVADMAEPVVSAATEELNVGDLGGKVEALQETLRDLGNQVEQGEEEIGALDERIAAAVDANAKLAKLQPVSELLKLVTTLNDISQRRIEIAQLEDQASKAQNLPEQLRLIEEASTKRAELIADMKAQGVQEDLLRASVSENFTQVQALIAEGLELDQQARTAIQSTEQLLQEHNEAAAENAELGEDLANARVNALRAEMELNELSQQQGQHRLSEREYLMWKLARQDELVELLKEEGAATEEILQAQGDARATRETLRAPFDALRQELDAYMASGESPFEQIKQRHADAMKTINENELLSAEERSAAIADVEQRRIDEMTAANIEAVKEVMAATEKITMGVLGLAQSATDLTFARLRDEVDVNAGTILAMLEDAAQGIADMAGEMTGLPIGEAFSAITGIGKALGKVVGEAVLLSDDAFRAEMERTNQLRDTVEQETFVLQLLEAQKKAMDVLLDQYKARNDEAREQMLLESDRARELANSINNLTGGQFGAGGFDTAQAAYESATQRQAQLSKEIADNEERLGDALGPKSRAKREEWARAMGIEMDQLNALIPALEEYMGLVSNVDELQRQAVRDRMATLDHEQAILDRQRKLALLRGEITQEQFDEQQATSDIDYLEKKRDETQDLLDIARQHYAEDKITLEELQAIELERYDLELQILEAKKAQNAEDEVSLDHLRDKHKRIQELVLASRGRTLTGAERAEIGALQAQIIQGMRDAGASEEAIQAAIAGFQNAAPSFDVGTPYVKNDQMAMVHEGERILTDMENRELIAAVRRMANFGMGDLGFSVPRMTGFGAGDVTYNIGDICVYAAPGQSAREIAQMVPAAWKAEMAKLHSDWHKKSPQGY